MKRSLDVLAETDGDLITPPHVLRVGGTTLTVVDEGDGRASTRLASWMAEAGATQLDATLDIDTDLQVMRVVVRDRARNAEARKRALALEAAADVVLGSARPAFARHLVVALLGDR